MSKEEKKQEKAEAEGLLNQKSIITNSIKTLLLVSEQVSHITLKNIQGFRK